MYATTVSHLSQDTRPSLLSIPQSHPHPHPALSNQHGISMREPGPQKTRSEYEALTVGVA